MKIAIVTGASSGLGREFVTQIAKKEQLDAIYVVARREDRLKQLADGSPVPVVPLPLDLTDSKSLDAVKNLLNEKKPDVRILVNAAGFGKMGAYSEVAVEASRGMIDLNCRALVDMTLITLPFMKKGARIIEICSVASFQPLPSLGVYAASKAFVQSYSRSLRWELFGRGIHVTAVCPYWIRDTEFIPVAKQGADKKAVRHFPFACRAKFVAKTALADSKLNLPVSTPGPVSFLMWFFTKIIPHEIVIAFWQLIRRI